MEPRLNTWFFESTQVYIWNGIWIGLAIFAGLMIVTDRPTDRATLSVIIGCIYLILQCGLKINHESNKFN